MRSYSPGNQPQTFAFTQAQCSPAEDNSQATANLLKRACEDPTNDVELRTSLGAALARLGKRTEGREELQSALQLNPNFEPAQKSLAALQ